MFQKLEADKEKYEELSRLMTTLKVISNPSEFQKQLARSRQRFSEILDLSMICIKTRPSR